MNRVPVHRNRVVASENAGAPVRMEQAGIERRTLMKGAGFGIVGLVAASQGFQQLPAEASGWSPVAASGQGYSGPLAGVDDLGRVLPDYTTAGLPRLDRKVGIFYLLWHGSNDMREYKNVINNNAILAADPTAYLHPDNGAWPDPGHFSYWGDPLFGYYRSDDAWVVRRHMQMLTDAQIDYLLLDASNYELYKPQVILLMQTIIELQSQGARTPQVAFMTHTNSRETMDEVYRTFYADDAPARYPSTWFLWDGKPLIMGNDPSPTVKDFFTFRASQWPNEPQQAGGWDWISFDRPQRANRDAKGSVEQIAVSAAQNSGSSAIFSYTAWYHKDNPPSLSRSFHDGAEDQSPGAENYGYNFQEEWDNAISQDPETILILEWNEWIAGNWAAKASDPLVFYDVADTRWSRDTELMAGGFGDNYYMQLVSNIRRYKGVNPPSPVSSPKTISVEAGFDQWQDVGPHFTNYSGGTMARNHPGTGTVTYVNNTGRNNIVAAKVARDDNYVYFYAQTAEKLTPTSDPNWMTLFLNVDGNGTNGWSGYDFVVNRDKTGSLERSTGGNNWLSVDAHVEYGVSKNELMLSVPRTALGLTSDDFSLQFKWSDNRQHDGSAMDFYVSGDSAPGGRFNYVYDTTKHPAAVPLAAVPSVRAPDTQSPGFHRIENDNRVTDYESFVTPKPSNWVTVPDKAASGGSYSYLSNPGGRADRFFRTFFRAGFQGNSVRWVTTTGPGATEAEVFVDGLSQGRVNLYSTEYATQQRVFEKYGLPDGQHEIMVVFLPQSGTYYHDYFEYGVGKLTYDKPREGEDLALHAWAQSPAFTPTRWSPSNAAQVNDAAPGSYWKGVGDGHDQIELSFGRTVRFHQVEIVPRSEGSTITGYDLQVHSESGWRSVRRGGKLVDQTVLEVGTNHADRLRLVVTTVQGGLPEISSISVFDSKLVAPVPTSMTHWEFVDGSEGWAGDGGLSGAGWSPTEGTLAGSVSGPGAQWTSTKGRELDVDLGRLTTVKLRMNNPTASTTGTVSFTTRDASGVLRDGSRAFRISAQDVGGSNYVLDLSGVTGWSGTLVSLSVNLGNATAGGAAFLDYLRLAPDNAVRAWHFTTGLEGWSPESDVSSLIWDSSGAATARVSGRAPLLVSAGGLRADITNNTVVKLRIVNQTSATTGRVLFTTESAPAPSDALSVPFTLMPISATAQELQVVMSSVPSWSGLLDRLWVELDVPEGAGSFTVHSVRVEPFVLTELSNVSAWEFTNSTEGWDKSGDVASYGWMAGGLVGGSFTGGDPQIYSADGLWLDLTDRPMISLRMRVSTQAAHGTLYFSTLADSAFSEGKSVKIQIPEGRSDFVDYTFDMTGVPGWTGVLKQLRVDPEEGDSTGDFAVAHVRILDFLVAPVTVVTKAGVAPNMPATVDVQRPGGSSTTAAVTWDNIDPALYASPGSFLVRGVVSGVDLAISALVTVPSGATSWEFASSAEGWGNEFGISDFGWKAPGYIGGSLWYADAQFFSPSNMGIPLVGLTTVTISLKNATAGTTGTLFFTTRADPSFTAAKSVPIPLNPNDTDFRVSVLDMSAVPGWSGTLDQFRFDPVEGQTAGAFLLDYLRIS